MRLGTFVAAALLTLCGCGGAPPHAPRLGDRSVDGANQAASADLAAAAAAVAPISPKRIFGRPSLPIGVDPSQAVFSDDDRLLAVGDDRGLLRIFDAAMGTPLVAHRAHDAAISLVAPAPGGGLVTGDGSGELAFWQPGRHGWLDATQELLASRHSAAITSVSFSADESVMVSADSDGNALLWNMKARKVVRQLDESEDSGDGVVVGRGASSHYVVSADGKHALGWRSSSCFVLALADAKRGPRLTVRGAITAARAERGGFSIDVRRERGGAMVREQVSLGGKRTSRAPLAPPGTVPLGPTAVLRAEAKRFAIVPTAGGTGAATFDLEPSDRFAAVVSRSGKRALVVSGGIALVDVERRAARVEHIEPGVLGTPLALVEAGRELLVSDGAHLHVFDLESAAPRGRLPLGPSDLFVSRDGKHWGGSGGVAFLIDAGSREVTFEREADGLAAFSPDAALLARREGATLRVVQTRDGKAVSSVDLGDRYPTSLAFAPDGQSVLVADAKGRVERLDARTGKRLAEREIERDVRAVIGWDEHVIHAQGRAAGGAATYLQLDAKSLAVRSEGPAGGALTRSVDGWSAWIDKDGVRLQKDASTIRLPEQNGPASALAFDATGQTLYVGRPGSVELWSVADITANSGARVDTADIKVQLPPAPGPAKKDAFGDPLPDHVLRRFGTVRGQLGRRINDVYVVRDEVWLIGDWGGAFVWDRKTGEPSKQVESAGTAGDRNTFITPDGQWVVSRGTTSIGVWSTATGKQTASVERKDAKDDSSALSPKGDRLAVGTQTGELVIFSVPKLAVLHRESGVHKTRVQALAYSPDGKTLASCGRFGVIRLSDGATGAKRRIITGKHTGEYDGCSALAFSPDSRTLYADLSGRQAFDVATGKLLGELTGDEGNVSQMLVSPKGDILIMGHHNDPVTVWDARKRTMLRSLATPDGGAAIAFTPDGKELLVGGADGILRAFDTTSWTEVGGRPSHSHIESIALVEQCRVLITADQSGQLRSWDAATGSLLASRVIKGSYPSLAATTGGLFLSAEGVIAIDPRTLADKGPKRDIGGGRLGVSSDGSLGAQVAGRELTIIDLKTGTTKPIGWGGGYVDAVAVDPRGKFVVAGGTNGAVRFFGPDGSELGGGRAGAPVRWIAFSPTEPVAFVAARREGSSPIYVAIEVPSGKQRWRSDMLPFSSSDAMAVSADGKLVAFADHEAIHFVEASSGRVAAKLPTKAAVAASNLVFSPDRKTLYADDGRTVLAWDISFIR